MALRDKQAAFVNEYLIDFNATRAAQRAGYEGNDATLASVGWENLRKPEIAKAIKERLQEKAMSADEVLSRLAEHARGNMDDFVRFDDRGNPTFDLQAASADGKLNLAKKLKVKTRSWSEPYFDNTTDEIEQREVTETAVEFELYDAQAALVHIGKHHKLFVDQQDIKHSGSVDMKATVTHDIDGDTATTIFDILASVGAIPTATDDAKDDEIHTAQADT